MNTQSPDGHQQQQQPQQQEQQQQEQQQDMAASRAFEERKRLEALRRAEEAGNAEQS
ncbi:hypothetical protein GCM10025760_25630 [Microbacterium yannicii]|uniref:Uncharacterized protein n=1 Tax=Microbacterium yannicii TaxID=671622 RepID=A0ABP9MEH6_9MICO|nr:hypothetical protein [Microbacterium yannicii]MCO5952943.1 hypothetical protein [Microbacterium yannicii]